MDYEINFNGKIAKIEFSENLTSDELTVVADTLIKCIENQRKLIAKAEATHLDIYDSFDKLYPPLSIRVENCLKRAGKKTIKDVLDCTPTEIFLIRNMGRKGADEVLDRFGQYGTFKEQKMEDNNNE